MVIRLLTIIIFFSYSLAQAECVILLHGLVRSNTSMKKMEMALQRAYYTVANIDYPSRKYPIEELAEKAISRGLAQCPKDAKVNFVTHSLGGILVRQYLHNHKIEKLNRVVMLGPPNKGSEVVDRLKDFPGFKMINGEAGLQLGTGEFSIPNQLGSVKFDLGIIAGTKSINLILSNFLPNPDDGKVSVESTKVDGMNDHIEMPVTHPFMMKNDKVIMQVIHYLRQGKFKH